MKILNVNSNYSCIAADMYIVQHIRVFDKLITTDGDVFIHLYDSDFGDTLINIKKIISTVNE